MTGRLGFTAGVVAVAVCVVSPALAQQPPATGSRQPQAATPRGGQVGQPPRAWIDGGVGAVGQELTAGAGLSAGRIRSRLREPIFGFGDARRESDIRSASGQVSYSLDGSRAGLSARVGTSGSYYSLVEGQTLLGYSGAANGYLEVTGRSTVTFGVSAEYEPAVLRSLRNLFDPRVELSFDIDPALVDRQALSRTTTVGFEQTLSTRASFSADYSRRQSDFGLGRLQEDEVASVGYRYQLTRGLGVRLGYRFGRNLVDEGSSLPATERHEVDAGIDFNRALSLTRRTTLSFGSGSTIAKSQDRTRFFLTGNLGLDHEMFRSWQTGVFYRRSAQFLEGITEIVVSDSAGATIGGQLSSRIGVQAQGTATRGNIGIDDREPFTAYQASAGASILVTQAVSVGLSHGYYNSDYGSGRFLIVPESRNLDGQTTRASVSVAVGRYVSVGASYTYSRFDVRSNESVQATVSLFAPIFSRARRPDAAR